MELTRFFSCIGLGLAAMAYGWVAIAAAGSGSAIPASGQHPPARAISMAPHITELIFAAGAGDRIVATVSSSDYPEQARRISRIGDGMSVSVEQIVALKPDVVIAWLGSGAAQALAPMLSRQNVALVYSQPAALGDIPAEITKFGHLFGTQAVAQKAAQQLSRRLQRLQEQYSHRPLVSVFIEVGSAPLYTIGRDPLLNDALRICGAENIFAKSALAAPQVSVEALLLAQPDVVITRQTSHAQQSQRIDEWSKRHLRAARKNHVYALDPDELFRPGPRLIDATEKLCRYIEQARLP